MYFNKIKIKSKYYLRLLFEFCGIAYLTPKFGLNGLDDKLEKYLDYRKGFFIEAGANNGIAQSNTYYLEFGKRWNGILIEAIPELYQKCKENRRRAHILNYALVSPDYSEKTLTLHYANLMSIGAGARTTEQIKDHIERGLKIQSISKSYTVEVPVNTLENILNDLKVKKIDFLSLDVEGAELDVIRGLNLTKYRPKYILVESNIYFKKVDQFLSNNSYKIVENMTHHDYLYVDTLEFS